VTGVGLLGPVELRTDGEPVDAGPPRQRLLLAALAVDAGRPVSVEALIERVWGAQAPERVRESLYVHVSRLRRLVGPAGLVRRAGGYVLAVEPDAVDLLRFRALVERAGLLPRADPAAVSLLEQALELWRGEPLAGLSGEWASRVREGCRRERLAAVAAWAEATVRTGDAARALRPLTELVAENPLVEPPAAALMRALHASGRTADALACYASARRRLVAELGVEPGSELRAAHQEILGAARTATTGDTASTATTATAGAVPAQLPLDVRGFTGRAAELARLGRWWRAAGDTTLICVLTGTAGVGKTTLALHWAHTMREAFPDGQLYADLRGFHPTADPLPPEEAIRTFLDALGVPHRQIPHGPAAQVGLYRSLLADRRALLVLDNVRDAEQVRPLLPASGTCAVLVTSRDQLTGLVAAAGAYCLPVPPLPVADARGLLRRRLGADRVAAEPAAVDAIIERCAGLPLALAVVAARATIRPGAGLGVLAGELTGLDGFADTDPVLDLRAVFSWSVAGLSGGAAELFALLGAHPGPDYTAPACASLAAVPVRSAGRLLTELARAHLVTEHAAGRYTMHDLLRAYAVELAGDRTDATRRVLDHYLHTARLAALALNPNRELPPLDPPLPGVVPEEPGAAWFAAELPVLLAAIGAGSDAHTTRLVTVLADYLDRAGHWHELAGTQRAALAAATRLADRTALARAHRDLGHAYTRLRQEDLARTELCSAVALSTELGDQVGAGFSLQHLALLAEQCGDYAEALVQAQRAYERHRTAGYPIGEARTLNLLGWLHIRRGEHGAALPLCERALALATELADERGQAATLHSIGVAHHHLGNHQEARTALRAAVELCQRLGDRSGAAEALEHLGDADDAAGDPAAALHHWQQALAILRELNHPDAGQLEQKLAERGP
jgi:DNA-binding SARP family transcriptional activator/tetratricopeptide (TPR) repeat protein